MDVMVYHGVAVADRITSGIFELTQSKLSIQLNDNRVCNFVLFCLDYS